MLAPLLHARLGEDEAGCDLRYNPHGGNRHDIPSDFTTALLITGPNTLTRQFSYEGWVITVGFRNSRAARMLFEHAESAHKYQPKYAAKIPDEEIRAILGANSGVGTWRAVPAEQLESPAGSIKAVVDVAKPARLWIRTDNAIAYLRGTYSQALYLEDRAYVLERYLTPKAPTEKPAPKPIPQF